jgi:hypothetical protein
MYCFGITLKSRQVCASWNATQAILRRTVCSIAALGQNVKILIACHEPPDLDLPNVTLLPVDLPIPRTVDEKKQDQFLKYFALGMAFKELGGGQFMAMDYDDLISCDLLNYVMAHPDPNGYLFSYGWVWEEQKRRLFPIPFQEHEDNALKRFVAKRLLHLDYRFDLVCGTCAMFVFAPDELPSRPYEACRFTSLFAAGHHKWRGISTEMGRPLHIVPRRLVTYVSGLPDSVSIEAGENINIGAARRGALRVLLSARALSREYRAEFGIA